MRGVTLDIAARKQTEQTLRQRTIELEAAKQEAERANRLKDRFLASVSHEIRAPLNAVLGWSDMLRKGALDDSRRQRALDAIHENAKRQQQLIDDLLDMGRIMSGTLRIEPRPVDLDGIVRGALEVVQPAADAKRIDIRTDIDRSMQPVFGDPARLQQILWNLLTNAIKFTPDGGTVQLRIRRAADMVEIAVVDSGQGIRGEFLPSVFEPFRQADDSITRSQRGLGLGLSIVKHLVDAHGGTVQAESAGDGQGWTFTVRLPIGAVPETAKMDGMLETSESLAPERFVRSLEGITVLVVDDDGSNRELIAACLGQRGATVHTAASAVEALATVQGDHVDVLLVDIAMPNEDGYTFIRKLRALPSTATIPAMALTAMTRAEDRERAMDAGFQMHIAKPVESDALIEAVAQLANRMATH